MQLRSFRSQYSPFVLCLPPPGPALGEPPGPPRTGEGLQYGLGSRMLSGLWKHTAALLPHGHLRGAPSQVKLQQHLTVPAAPGSGQAATITPRDSTRGWDLHMGTERKAGAPCWRGKQVSAGMGPAALHGHNGGHALPVVSSSFSRRVSESTLGSGALGRIHGTGGWTQGYGSSGSTWLEPPTAEGQSSGTLLLHDAASCSQEAPGLEESCILTGETQGQHREGPTYW